MSKKVLQLVGQPGAGKTEVSTHLCDSYGFNSVLISDMIRDYALPRGIPLVERKDYAATRRQMLRELGKSAIVEQIISVPSELIVVDGVRVPSITEALKLWHGSKVIALECPPEIRYERVQQRKRDLDKSSLEGFLADESAESFNTNPDEASVLTIIETADYHVDSSRPLTQVIAEVDEIVVPYLAT